MSVFFHELKINRTTLIIWTLSLAAFMSLMLLIYPQFKDTMIEMSSSLTNMGSFSDAFGMDKLKLSDALGYYGLENGTMLTLGGSLFAGILGVTSLSKEEADRTAEYLFSLRQTRLSVILQKLEALIFQIIIFSSFIYLSSQIVFRIIGEEVDQKALLIFNLACLLLFLQVGMLCFGISAFLKNRTLGLAIGLALALYFLLLIINMSKNLDLLKYITPFAYSDPASVISSVSIEIKYLISNFAIAMTTLFVGIFFYCKKDLAN